MRFSPEGFSRSCIRERHGRKIHTHKTRGRNMKRVRCSRSRGFRFLNTKFVDDRAIQLFISKFSSHNSNSSTDRPTPAKPPSMVAEQREAMVWSLPEAPPATSYSRTTLPAVEPILSNPIRTSIYVKAIMIVLFQKQPPDDPSPPFPS